MTNMNNVSTPYFCGALPNLSISTHVSLCDSSEVLRLPIGDNLKPSQVFLDNGAVRMQYGQAVAINRLAKILSQLNHNSIPRRVDKIIKSAVWSGIVSDDDLELALPYMDIIARVITPKYKDVTYLIGRYFFAVICDRDEWLTLCDVVSPDTFNAIKLVIQSFLMDILCWAIGYEKMLPVVCIPSDKRNKSAKSKTGGIYRFVTVKLPRGARRIVLLGPSSTIPHPTTPQFKEKAPCCYNSNLERVLSYSKLDALLYGLVSDLATIPGVNKMAQRRASRNRCCYSEAT